MGLFTKDTSIWGKIKSTLGTLAPAVSSILGTNIAGIALRSLCEILGLPINASPNDIFNKVSDMDAATLLKLKELELNTKTRLKELDITEAQIQQMDRISAREREAALRGTGQKDWLQIITVASNYFYFVLAIGFLLMGRKLNVPDSVTDVIILLIGQLMSERRSVLDYIFGSSRGSADKEHMLNDIINK